MNMPAREPVRKIEKREIAGIWQKVRLQVSLQVVEGRKSDKKEREKDRKRKGEIAKREIRLTESRITR